MKLQTIGTLLRDLRRQRNLTQERLASRAQVTARTIRYWESDQQQPRLVELESVLKAMNVTARERAQVFAQLPDHRTVQLVRNAAPVQNIPADLLGPLPGIGDLLRAMRIRQNLTQEQLAEALGLNRATVMRWEATRAMPGDEDLDRLCTALQAAPEEECVLKARRLLPASWQPQLSLEGCREKYEQLLEIQSRYLALWPLVELYCLALKRQLRFLLAQHDEALKLLARVELAHSAWLQMRGRASEACAGHWRTLNLVRGRFPPEMFWLRALNLLAAHAVSDAHAAENGLKLLYPWLRLLPASLHTELLCDLAYYAGQARQHDEAETLLARAQRAFAHYGGTEKSANWYYRMTRARVLLSQGRAIDALDWLPAQSPPGIGSIFERQIWAEVYLGAGENQAATATLQTTQELLDLAPMPMVPLIARQQRLKLRIQHN